MNLKQWFENPSPPIVETFNPPEISRHLMGAETPEPIPPPQRLYDLASYPTPFAVLFKRARNILQG